MERYWKPAFIAGMITGIVSAIPIISFLNCCCLWIVLGIIWAVWMYRNEYGYVDIGPGAALGGITGAIAGFISGFLNIIVWAILGEWYQTILYKMISNFNLPPDALSKMQVGPSILSAFFGIITYAIVGAIVGLIMGAIWKRKPEHPIETASVAPPPPTEI